MSLTVGQSVDTLWASLCRQYARRRREGGLPADPHRAPVCAGLACAERHARAPEGWPFLILFGCVRGRELAAESSSHPKLKLKKEAGDHMPKGNNPARRMNASELLAYLIDSDPDLSIDVFDDLMNDPEGAMELMARMMDMPCPCGSGEKVMDCCGGELDTALQEREHVGIADAAALPRERIETWQGGVFKLRTWVEEEGEPYRPYSVLWGGEFIYGQTMLPHAPTPEETLQTLLYTMAQPVMGQPRRPTTVQVADPDLHEYLLTKLHLLDVNVELCESLDELAEVVEELQRGMAAEGPPGHLSAPGVTPQMVESLFRSAAEFYKCEPWRRLSDYVPVQVHCPAFEKETVYAALMGHAGLTEGLAVFETLAAYDRMGELDDLDEEDALDEIDEIVVFFNEETEVPFEDLDAIEEHGWPVAGPEAHPVAMRMAGDEDVRRPVPWELDVLEACLLAIPSFVSKHCAKGRLRRPGVESVTVRTFHGERELTLTCPPERE